jgi:hypothetical protein
MRVIAKAACRSRKIKGIPGGEAYRHLQQLRAAITEVEQRGRG